MGSPARYGLCVDCGAPLKVVLSGGEEPDPGRPGKWRKATTVGVRCPVAFEVAQAEEVAALDAIRAKHSEHLRVVWLSAQGAAEPSFEQLGLDDLDWLAEPPARPTEDVVVGGERL